MKVSRVLDILLEEVGRITVRADYNVNHNDLYIAIEEAQKRVREEEEAE